MKSFSAIGVALLLALGASPVLCQDAASLRARYIALRTQLEANDFKRPLYLDSGDSARVVRGDIYAALDEPYALVGPALQAASSWCEILILHMNVKHCRAAAAGDRLAVAIGRKYEQPADDAYGVDFRYRRVASEREYLQVALDADAGPFGTRAYRLALQAVQIEPRRTFVHLSYSYEYGFAARLAMEAYLHTAGRNKVGFTVLSRRADGTPVYIDGVRGVMERNAMRYFLAVDVYLDSLRVAPAERVERRLRDWFAQTERYPAQLHELELADYLAMKHREIARQAAM
jgi:hypothetical protein